MFINEHELIHAKDAGGGFHGNCKYCEIALVTSLGYCSWDNTTCIDRPITRESELPEDMLSFVNFRGLKLNNINGKISFIKPYSDETYTLSEINSTVKKLKEKYE